MESLPQDRDHIRQIVAEEVALEHKKLSQQNAQQTIENNLLDIFYIRYNKPEGGLKKDFYKIIETVLIDIARKELEMRFTIAVWNGGSNPQCL